MARSSSMTSPSSRTTSVSSSTSSSAASSKPCGSSSASRSRSAGSCAPSSALDSSAMIRLIEERISSIDGSCCSLRWVTSHHLRNHAGDKRPPSRPAASRSRRLAIVIRPLAQADPAVARVIVIGLAVVRLYRKIDPGDRQLPDRRLEPVAGDDLVAPGPHQIDLGLEQVALLIEHVQGRALAHQSLLSRAFDRDLVGAHLCPDRLDARRGSQQGLPRVGDLVADRAQGILEIVAALANGLLGLAHTSVLTPTL